MDFKLKIMSQISKKKIIEDIIRVDKIINKELLTKTEYCKHSKVSGNTVNNYFSSWHDALVASGLECKSNNRIPTHKLKNQKSKFMKDEDIIEELRSVAKKLGKQTITMKDLNENSNVISGSTIKNRFGWRKGLELAKLNIAPLGKRYTNEECFSNLLDVWTFYGRSPKKLEMNKAPSVVGANAYIKRWGSWIKALESFVEEVNNTSGEEKETETVLSSQKLVVKNKIKIEDQRDISIGLRYKVLSRDNFKCVRCGRSPATTLGVELHIDHKLPFSIGGKTTLENLETKCKECNLGKSNRHTE